MATLHIPALLRDLVGGAEALPVPVPPGARPTVRDLLVQADTDHPGLLAALTDQGDLLPGIAVFVDDEQALLGLRTRVSAEADVRFLPPIVGGL